MHNLHSANRARLLSGTTLAVIAVLFGATPAAAQTAQQPSVVTPGDQPQPVAPPTATAAGNNGNAQTSTVADPNGQAGSQVNAQGATTQESAPDVVVTGSRIARTGFAASTPVNVFDAEDIKLSGNVNIERSLAQTPQVVASQLGGATSNTVPGGYADVNLRGFGSTRNLVLVNGRRFAIFGPEQVTDLNTIPTSLIARTEIVTGGSSAVYGSDAITGVINFIMRNDFEGVEGRAQVNMDRPTGTPTYNFDLTMGGNFNEGRGNLVVSGNYLERGAITRGDRGSFAFLSLADGCTVPGSGSATRPGTSFTPTGGQSCTAGGGELGFIASGSGDIPNGRFSGIAAAGGANTALNAAYAAAGLSGLTSRGFTFDAGGTAARPALTPQDDFNLGPDNYLIQPQKRWMINSFGHYDFSDHVTGYMELHYSNNEISARLAPTNIGSPTLFNVNNPYLTPALQNVLRVLDGSETGTATVTAGTARYTNQPNDGLALVTAGRRYVEVGPRMATERRNVFRGAWGFRGDLGQVSENFLTDLKYDVYYTYSRSEDTLLLQNALSRSRVQANLLSVNGAAPTCDIFGARITEACAAAIRISATNSTIATQQVAQGNITGTLFRLPAGPVGFSYGYEWRKTDATFSPDSFLASGDVAGFNPGLPTRGSVSVKEVFGELRVPIIHDTPFVESLVANGAFRYSNYSLAGIGGNWTYLGGLDWRVNKSVALRGQYQRAIRAPNVSELYGGVNRVTGVANDPCSNRVSAALQTATARAVCIATGVPAANVFTAAVQPNTIIPADFGGNQNLAAEKSDTYTAGVVFTPSFAPRLFVSVDYFKIQLDGAISSLGGGLQNTLNLCYNTIQDASSPFCQAISRSPSTGEISDPFVARILNANTGSLKTSGIDLAARYRFTAGFGFPGLGETSTFDVGSNFTWLNDFTSVPVAALPNLQNHCQGSFGPTCGQPLPIWRGVSRATWTTGPLALSVRHRYIGPVTTDRYIVPLRQGSAATPALASIAYPKLPSRNYFDLSFSYDIAKTMQFFGGANNVLNQNPPITTQGPSANTFAATYDVLGTEFFLGITAKF